MNNAACRKVAPDTPAGGPKNAIPAASQVRELEVWSAEETD